MMRSEGSEALPCCKTFFIGQLLTASVLTQTDHSSIECHHAVRNPYGCRTHNAKHLLELLYDNE